MQIFDEALLFIILTEVFAYSFLLLQIDEYFELSFTLSDNIYSSLFFLLTGFHGMHVVVGTIFIIVTHERIYSFHYTTNKILGFGFALIY